MICSSVFIIVVCFFVFLVFSFMVLFVFVWDFGCRLGVFHFVLGRTW